MDKITTSSKGIKLTPLKTFEHEKGDVYHGLKATEESFQGFGEAYFSTIGHGKLKGWKKHTRMHMNLVVPIGEIRFVIYDDRGGFGEPNFQEVTLGPNNYQRLSVEPGLWMAFEGVGKGLNMVLNIASIPHDPTESITLPLDTQEIPKYF